MNGGDFSSRYRGREASLCSVRRDIPPAVVARIVRRRRRRIRILAIQPDRLLPREVLLQRDARAGGDVDDRGDRLHEHGHDEVQPPVARGHVEAREAGGVRRARRADERAGVGGEDAVEHADAEEGERGGDRDEQLRGGA